MADKPPPPVGHTCIAIDKAIACAKAAVHNPDARREMQAHLEVVRQENVALRARLAWFEE